MLDTPHTSQLYFAGLVAERIRKRALRGVGGILFHNVAFWIQQQRGAVFDLRRAGAHRDDDGHDDDHEDDVDHQPSREIDQRPHAHEKADEPATLLVCHNIDLRNSRVSVLDAAVGGM